MTRAQSTFNEKAPRFRVGSSSAAQPIQHALNHPATVPLRRTRAVPVALVLGALLACSGGGASVARTGGRLRALVASSGKTAWTANARADYLLTGPAVDG